MAGTHSVVFLATGISMVVIVHVFVLVWALKWGFRTRPARVTSSEHADQEGGRGLSSEEVSELPCHDCKEGTAAGDCAVCLEAFRPGERRRVLPGCGHGFHAECVDSWLRKSRRCPICRAEVVAGQGKNTGAVSEPAALEIVTER
ncbi:hypothetical protein BS78_04G264500 [Paspalum vaginatum]|nr:hypothetical protein BS78_04G264500 [Paspalum vaginatum]